MLRRDFCLSLLALASATRAATTRDKPAFSGPLVDITQYGAIGDGQFDCTESIQSAVHAAAQLRAAVYIPAGIFSVSHIVVVPGLRGVLGTGTLKGLSPKPEAVIIAEGSVDRPLKGLVIQVSIDCAKARRGVFLQYVADSAIRQTTVANVSYNGGDGIRIHVGCERIEVAECTISCATDTPYGTYAQGLNGIRIVSETVSPTAGFLERGVLTSPKVTSKDHRITNNVVLGGTHGITVFGGSDVVIAGNRCVGQSHRNIICSPSATRVHIEGNDLQECGSSGIHCAFGSSDIVVVRNRIKSNSVLAMNDAAAIQMYIGCRKILVRENEVDGNFTYGIHGSFETQQCHWIDNAVRLRDGMALAGLSIESDWASLASSKRPYSRPRRSSRKALQPTSDFEVVGNDIEGAKCGVSLAQVHDASVRQISIQRNTIRAARTPSSRILACVEDVPGQLRDIAFDSNFSDTDNRPDRETYLLSRQMGHFSTFKSTGPIPKSKSRHP